MTKPTEVGSANGIALAGAGQTKLTLSAAIMASQLNFEQLLSGGLPLNLVIAGRDFFPDMIGFLRSADDVYYACVKDGMEPYRHTFEGPLSKSFLSRRDLALVQSDHGGRFIWRYRGDKSIVLPDLAWLCEALADGYAEGSA